MGVTHGFHHPFHPAFFHFFCGNIFEDGFSDFSRTNIFSNRLFKFPRSSAVLIFPPKNFFSNPLLKSPRSPAVLFLPPHLKKSRTEPAAFRRKKLQKCSRRR